MKNENSSKVSRSVDIRDIESCHTSTGRSSGLFDAVNDYYESLFRLCVANRKELDSCFAVRLASDLIDYLKMEDIKLTKNKTLPQSFYDRFVEDNLKRGYNISDDDELIEIYAKQCVIILKKSGIISTAASRARIVKRNDNVPLYLEMFEAFWNKNEWDSLFPSNTKAARELKNKRFVFINHLLKIENRTRVESLANRFFSATGIADKNNLLMISFIDFYLLTWLTHFGIITYSPQTGDNAVYIELTGTGRELLENLYRDGQQH